MRILRNYALRECILPFILSLFILTSIFLLGNLIQLTDMVINKGVRLVTIWQIFLYSIPLLMHYALPIALLIGVILGISQLSANNEIIALRASGVYLGRLVMPFFMVGLIFSLVSIILNERIIPHAKHERLKLMKNLSVSNPAALLEPGMFIHAFDGQILFIHKLDGNRMYNVTFYQTQPDGPTRTIIAKRGEFTPVPGENKIKIKLIDGTSDEPSPADSSTFYKLNFEEYYMTLDLSKNQKKIDKKPDGMTFKELKTEIARLETLLVDTAPLRTEFHRKITWAFSALFFILMGFPLAIITHRREKSLNVVLAFVCTGAWFLLSVGCEALSHEGLLTPGLILWIPNILAGILASILIYKCVS